LLSRWRRHDAHVIAPFLPDPPGELPGPAYPDSRRRGNRGRIRRIERQPASEHPSPVCCICTESAAKIHAKVAACRCSAGNPPVFSTGGPRQAAKSSKIRRCKPLPFGENRRCKPCICDEPAAMFLFCTPNAAGRQGLLRGHQSLSIAVRYCEARGIDALSASHNGDRPCPILRHRQPTWIS